MLFGRAKRHVLYILRKLKLTPMASELACLERATAELSNHSAPVCTQESKNILKKEKAVRKERDKAEVLLCCTYMSEREDVK